MSRLVTFSRSLLGFLPHHPLGCLCPFHDVCRGTLSRSIACLPSSRALFWLRFLLAFFTNFPSSSSHPAQSLRPSGNHWRQSTGSLTSHPLLAPLAYVAHQHHHSSSYAIIALDWSSHSFVLVKKKGKNVYRICEKLVLFSLIN